MKNIMKLCLLLVMCASLLLVVGCAKKGTEDTAGTTGAADVTEGTGEQQAESTAAQDETGEADVDAPVGSNPEGDPFDAIGDTDVGAEDESQDEGGEDPQEPVIEPEEPAVDVDADEEDVEATDDFEVDFSDLT